MYAVVEHGHLGAELWGDGNGPLPDLGTDHTAKTGPSHLREDGLIPMDRGARGSTTVNLGVPCLAPAGRAQAEGTASLVQPEFCRFGPMQDHFLGRSTNAMGPKTPVLGCECGEWGCRPLMARITLCTP
ncbi:hypothetical protein EAO70_00830 [Streptomyces sp. adm13(2018)]|nr:hypothetical protein EAO70_00830 [Streptomyces sp. adm13(2018)]